MFQLYFLLLGSDSDSGYWCELVTARHDGDVSLRV